MIRALVIAALLCVYCAQTSAQPFSMDDFMWTQRPLLIFAPSADFPGARGFVDALRRAKAGLMDRDMVLIEVYGNDRASFDGRRLPAGTARELRERYGVAEREVVVVLVGKDGGEKLRAIEAVDPEQIFDLIDTMPMRRQEMRQRQSSRGGASGD